MGKEAPLKLAEIVVGEPHAVSINQGQLLIPQGPDDFISSLRADVISLNLSRVFDRAKAQVLAVALPYGKRQTNTGVLVEATYKAIRNKPPCPTCGHQERETDENGLPTYEDIPVQALISAQQVHERWVEHEIDRDHLMLQIKERRLGSS